MDIQDIIIQAEERKLIAKILAEEQIFMIQLVEEQEVIEPTQTAELQNMTPMDEKLEVLDNLKI